MDKIICTIEARMKSSRLPGKVLSKIGKHRCLDLQIQRLRKSKFIEEIVIASTLNKNDDLIEDFATKNNFNVFRGSENDITKRIIDACIYMEGNIIVQITGDCPFVDPVIVDNIIKKFLQNKDIYDLVGNNLERSYPIGLDCRVFSLNAIQKVDNLCLDKIHRIHGSTFMYSDEGKSEFNTLNIIADDNYYKPSLRLTLDTVEDLNFFNSFASKYDGSLVDISTLEIIEFLEKNQDLIKINSKVRQKELHEG